MSLKDRLAETARSTRVLVRSGALAPERPDRLWHMASAARHWGVGLGAAFATTGARYETRTAIIDERGSVDYRTLDARTDALARALLARGIGPGDTVAVLCRNSRYFFDAAGALAKVGANAVYLNTGFSTPQLGDVVRREHVQLVVHDAEFDAMIRAAGVDARIVAWTDDESPDADTVDELVGRFTEGPRPPRPAHEGRTIILTSGTTGLPKGASREQVASAGPAIALLERIPYHARDTMIISAPCFHSWGFSNALVGLLLGNTLVLDRHFDPERVLASIARHRAQVFAAVPVMLGRLLALPADTRARYDPSSLRVVPLSGSSLPGDLAIRFMDAFGDVLYNLYGSTEVGSVTIADPADLRAAPTTAGRPPRGTELRLLDEHDREVPIGATGRIFVRSGLLFDGYTDGGSKPVVAGFMQTGDTGHLDASGRLFVDGRDDDMIVSGGENVFPGEIEDVITRHPDVVEAAVIGIDDPEFGQRLKAFVVRRPGTALDADAVQEYVRANLARFKVPRDVEFVETLPRNATGKIVRRELGA